MRPTLFVGEGGGNSLLQVGETAADDGVAFEALGQTARVAPNGVKDEVLVGSFYYALSWVGAVTLRFTPYLNGVALDPKDIDLPAGAARQFSTFGVDVSVPYEDEFGTELARVGARGTWVQVTVQSVGGVGDGLWIVEAVEAEVEPVQRYRDPEE